MEPLIKAENLSVVYNEGKSNEFTALNDISLEIFPEEYVIFFGPSGSGKSTMLYSLLGLQKASHGKVYVKGEDISAFSEAKKSSTTSQYFGIVFQNFNLIYSLNVADNIMLPQVFAGVSHNERKIKAKKLMERFGIATRANSLPSNLSGGQQQRVAICRSLINDPHVLLADEPVGNLDSESAQVVMRTLSEINRNDKKTVILVTHDASYLPFADKVFYFKDAKLERVVKNESPVMPGGAVVAGVKELHLELERLGNVRHSLTTPELKAWAVTQFLLREMTVGQIERLEKNMENVLSSAISLIDFHDNLHASYEKGGVGLHAATADKYAHKVGDILITVDKMKKSFTGTHKQKLGIIHLLRRFVLNEYHELTHSQITRLERAIVARIKQEVTPEEFVSLIHRPVTAAGVNLRLSTARHIADTLETVLAAAQTYENP